MWPLLMRRVDAYAFAASALMMFLVIAVSENLYFALQSYSIIVNGQAGIKYAPVPCNLEAFLMIIPFAAALAAYLQIFGALPIIYALSFAKQASLAIYVFAGALTIFVAHPMLLLLYVGAANSSIEFLRGYYVYFIFWRGILTSLWCWMLLVPASIAWSATYWRCKRSGFLPPSAAQGPSRTKS